MEKYFENFVNDEIKPYYRIVTYKQRGRDNLIMVCEHKTDYYLFEITSGHGVINNVIKNGVDAEEIIKYFVNLS